MQHYQFCRIVSIPYIAGQGHVSADWLRFLLSGDEVYYVYVESEQRGLKAAKFYTPLTSWCASRLISIVEVGPELILFAGNKEGRRCEYSTGTHVSLSLYSATFCGTIETLVKSKFGVIKTV